MERKWSDLTTEQVCLELVKAQARHRRNFIFFTVAYYALAITGSVLLGLLMFN